MSGLRSYCTKHSNINKCLMTPLWVYVAAAAKSLQSCPTLGNPIDGSPPGSTVPEILQARTLEWVAIAFSVVLLGICIKVTYSQYT